MSLTPAQREAIVARGNVLIVAGAGTGKTSTLVERCLHCLIEAQPAASLDEILIVTFTDAAAAEMRRRIRARLEEEMGRAPQEMRWHEQLSLFETAQIGTLHSFCLQLIRQHFHELELDPRVSVMAEEESRLLADETLDAVLQGHYSGKTEGWESVQRLIQVQGGGWDVPIRRLVLRMHHYTQTLPDPARWFEDQITACTVAEPRRWLEWLLAAVIDWREDWVEFIAEKAAENRVAATCVAAMQQMKTNPSRAEAAAVFEQIAAAAKACPFGHRIAWLDPLERFLAETEFLLSLTRTSESTDPLVEDWTWVRPYMTTLLGLAREFGEAFAEAKRELGTVDFHDLEQHALRLLWDARAGRPTAIAEDWRAKLRFVLVDEYQDINAVQDRIIATLSREGAGSNRFLVGDVKQSIYRFRLANPKIFQAYVEQWKNGAGQAIALVDNFRSRELVLSFVNSLFGLIMRQQIGGVAYGPDAQLAFGAAERRKQVSAASSAGPAVELHLYRRKPRQEEEEEEESVAMAEVHDMADADKEARILGLRLQQLKNERFAVWDEAVEAFRPVEWKDMAILLRSPAGKAESYAKEFSRLGIPLAVERGKFYESIEISDLLSLLRLLDNPLQDVPVLAVLHSPLVGLSIDELSKIRLSCKGPFWTALLRWQAEPSQAEPEAKRKVDLFLERFGRWRRLARQMSLSRCLDMILNETFYSAWLLTQPRGEQRHGNVQRLLGLAQQFDHFQRQGLFRFLRLIEAQQEAEVEPEVAPVHEESSVRLMSIHQSKGLEFPVVAVADLGKPFNMSDLRSEIILDETFGLCPQIKPPHSGKRYPSLPHWLARRRQAREMAGEELRLLYVATTRARDRLILSGCFAASRFDKYWKRKEPITTRTLASAYMVADWLGCWFSGRFQPPEGTLHGEDDLVRWTIHSDKELWGGAPELSTEATEVNGVDLKECEKVRQRVSWKYPFGAATVKPAKTSATMLSRRSVDLEESSLLQAPAAERLPEFRTRPGPGSAVIGSAHHQFLQRVSLEAVGDAEGLRAEAERLVRDKVLVPEMVAELDIDGLAAFWNSALGRDVRRRSGSVHRELEFTARFTLEELQALSGETVLPEVAEEWVVVQGVVDLAVVQPAEIWIVDFKTDRTSETPKVQQYQTQLRLYAKALARIYKRPVTGCWLYFLSARQTVPVSVG